MYQQLKKQPSPRPKSPRPPLPPKSWKEGPEPEPTDSVPAGTVPPDTAPPPTGATPPIVPPGTVPLDTDPKVPPVATPPIDRPKQINLLLVGETGVGKSTLVNAFANYCKFSSLEEAVKAGGEFPIPCTFVINHPGKKNISSHVIPAAKSQSSKAAEVGQSDTKMPGVYVFRYKNYEVNLIDTPGLMDTKNTKDHDVDKKHVTEISRLLSAYDEIHAICILLKANQTILSKAFTYTLSVLFKLLDEGARDNVVFIFTCAASTSFKPGTAQVILEKFLSINKLLIPLAESNVYCFENNTMQYLVERKCQIPSNDDDKVLAHLNWKKSANSTKAMLDYVCSSKPHSLSGMHAIHDVERKIGVLSKFVLETMMCVFKDRDDLEERKRRVEAMRNVKLEGKVLDELSEVKETKVVCKQLGYYNIVCRSCTEVKNGQIVYREPCCRNCGGIFMYLCTNINWMADCKKCGCDVSKHEWVNFETEIVTETVKLPQPEVEPNKGEVNQPIVDSNALVNAIHSSICRRVANNDEETEQMLKICAQLNTFVRQSVLMSSSDDDELSKGLQNKLAIHTKESKSNVKEVTYLQQIQTQYQKFLDEEKQKIQTQHQQFLDEEKQEIQTQHQQFLDEEKQEIQTQYQTFLNNYYGKDYVDKLIQKLYELPTKGRDLRKAMDEEEKARKEIVVAANAECNIPKVHIFVKVIENALKIQ